MKRITAVLIATACLTQVGCYHQVFNTGLAPSNTVITKAWHPTYIFGLVAAQPIDVRSQCPSGVAIASTRMSFPNGLVGVLTLGLFTPHEVTVTCASRGAVLPGMAIRHVASGCTREEANRVVADAIDAASRGTGSVAIVIDTAADIVATPAEASR